MSGQPREVRLIRFLTKELANRGDQMDRIDQAAFRTVIRLTREDLLIRVNNGDVQEHWRSEAVQP
mgnify:CR=1 FL=1